jgi:hypothetical protein
MAGDAEALGFGLAGMARGERSDEAIAATELVAESLIWWRAIARTKLRGADPPAPTQDDDGMTAAERAYYARKGGV